VRRRTLHLLDRRLLGRCHAVFAQSGTIRDRLARWGGVDAEVLYPPAPERPYRSEDPGGHLLSVSRLTELKRVDLLLDAAALDPRIRARVAGEGPEAGSLRRRATALGIAERVEFIGHLSEEALVSEYARCSAVWFGARAEDYGLVTLEAFRSGKSVVTCGDSGGPAELVDDGVNGYVVEPDAAAVAGAAAILCSDSGRARELGAAAARTAARHSWTNAVARLLEA
jgi:glycosyltransferase involved in cell wall biosynthesis